MPEQTTRRTFLKAAAAAPALVAQGARAGNANSKLQHACIGVGGMGKHDLRQFMNHPKVEVVALCDADAYILADAAAKVPAARTYADWRELLVGEAERVDSVNVCVPDHNHAIITVGALGAGKHVYCQKPLCHDVAECRTVARRTRSAGKITQLGTQDASGIGDRMAVQLIKQGAIGKIKRVVLFANRPKAIERYRLKGPRPATGTPPPAHLSWDLWIGTAPDRQYTENIYHQTRWRAWQDFGTGWSGDMGCHLFDAVWKSLDLKAPRTVKAEVQGSWKVDAARRRDNWPQSDHITWVFGGNDLTAEDHLVLEWFDGWFYPPPAVQAIHTLGDFYPGEGAMFIGTEGNLLLPAAKTPLLYPVKKFKDHRLPEPPPRNHYHHFVDACLGGEMCESHFQQTGPMTEAILLGTVALRVPDTVLEWDAGRLKIPNHPQSEHLLLRSYRSGWEVPGLCVNASV